MVSGWVKQEAAPQRDGDLTQSHGREEKESRKGREGFPEAELPRRAAGLVVLHG